MKSIRFIPYFFAVCFALNLNAAIQVFPIARTPTNASVQVEIDEDVFLQKGESITLEVKSFPMGVQTQSSSMRGAGVRQRPEGTSLLIFFDGLHRFQATSIDVVPLFEKKAYFTKPVQIRVPSSITRTAEKGEIPLIILPINSYGESIKNPGAAGAVVISHAVPNKNPDCIEAIKKPFVLYNMPEGSYKEDETVLLDFYLMNAQISEKGYSVRVTLNGEPLIRLTEWVPYGIKGIPPGNDYILQVDLLDKGGNVIPNPFGSQRGKISIIAKP